MPSLLNACKRLLFNSLIVLVPGAVCGQGLVPSGQEYCIGGALFGDQVRPQVVLGASGGWLVWQDNSIDGQGFGIAAGQLGATYGTVASRFRVNESLGGNQEKPCLTQLKDGTVMFAWEGYPSVLPNVYARFMTPTRVFKTAEIPMTTTFPMLTNRWTTNVWSWVSNHYILRKVTLTRVRQETRTGNTDPAVTALDDGTAVLVYSGMRQHYASAQQLTTEVTIQQGLPYANDTLQWITTSGDDIGEVFMQRFASNGAKLGEETLVNQFSQYNQRRPAVAALPGGNFVVVWVSERYFPEVQNGAPVDGKARSDVQISGRLFSSSGVPVCDEFRINATNAMTCADPSICVAADGRFMVTWSQFVAKTTNKWDICARVYGGDGRANGESFRVNTYTLGDQSESKVAVLGGDFLVTWTSFGQDGSQEGVYGQLVSDGVLAGPEFRINTNTRNKQMQPAVAPLGTNGFMTVWAHFAGITSGFNLMAQKYDESTVTKPNPPSVTPISQSSLLVSWPAVSALKNYSVYVDGAVAPITLTNTSYEANGLQPGSTHSYRLAYALTDGAVSRVSDPASGTTWSSAQSAQLAGNDTNTLQNSGTLSGGTPSSGAGQDLIHLLMVRNGTNFILQWNSQTGMRYQTQVSTNLQSWSNVGGPQDGTGTTSTQTYPAEADARFYRVIRVN